jgi:hypothetical protein
VHRERKADVEEPVLDTSPMTDKSADLTAAEQFLLHDARILERRRFDHRFRGGSSAAVFAALLAFRNEDGGFGNALESDIRGRSSQPVPLENALHVLDDVDAFDRDVVAAGCDWLASVSTEEGGVPFVLETVEDGPHAPWWEPTGKAYLNPTAGIAGLLYKRDVDHPWLEPATAFCWTALERDFDDIGPDDAVSILDFLEHVPDRDRAEVMFERLGKRIVGELAALDPAATGYVKSPLEYAPNPDRLGRRLFDDATIDAHLDALAGKQQDDGGWPITWEPPSAAAVNEWRGFVTLRVLTVLDDYGRLDR